MGQSLEENYSQVEEMIVKGNYISALEIIEKTEQISDIAPGSKLKFQILKARILLDLGEYQKSLVLSINTFQESEKLCERVIMIESKIAVIASMRHLGKFKEANNVVKEAEILIGETEETYKTDLKLQKARLLFNKGICGRATGNQDVTNESLPKSIEIFEILQNETEYCDSLEAKAMHIDAGKGYKLAIETLMKSLKIREKIGNKQRLANTYNRIGVNTANLGLNDEALDYYIKGLEIAKELKIKDLIAIFNLNMGNISSKKGQLAEALNSYLEAQQLSRPIGNKHMSAAIMINVADIYLRRGEIEKALEYNKLVLKDFEDLNFRQGIAAILRNIGKVYYTKGNLELASTFFNESLSIRQELNDISSIAEILYNLVSIYLEEGLLEQAKDYHSQLEEIKEQNLLPIINHLYSISEAKLLKSTPRLKNRVMAEELLQSVIEADIISHTITIDAYLLLCELLLDELRLLGDKSVLAELTEYIENLFDIAKVQQSHSLLAKTYLLKSQLALINFEVDKAKDFLSQAQFIAEEKELHGLAYNISEEYDNLINHKDDWILLAQRNAPLSERLALITMNDALRTMIGNKDIILPEIVQEEPVYLIIQNDSGKTIFTEKFQPLSKLDGALIGGFIAALNSFVQELFHTPGHIERIKHQNHTLVLKIHKGLLVTYIYKGQSYSSIKKLNNFVDSLASATDLWKALQKSSTSLKMLNVEEISSIQKISESCFAP
ncbi:MAG: tetratricopeptide repeat protein [Candidatus Heimdallarchaeaceae archaeon]